MMVEAKLRFFLVRLFLGYQSTKWGRAWVTTARPHCYRARGDVLEEADFQGATGNVVHRAEGGVTLRALGHAALRSCLGEHH